jgi:hypothetical protein
MAQHSFHHGHPCNHSVSSPPVKGEIAARKENRNHCITEDSIRALAQVTQRVARRRRLLHDDHRRHRLANRR